LQNSLEDAYVGDLLEIDEEFVGLVEEFVLFSEDR
jgi:hypothetical protein